MPTTMEPTFERLDGAISEWLGNKTQYDSLKKVCEKQNAVIKDMMLGLEVDSRQVDGYKVSRSVSTTESINEEVLLSILHEHDIPGIIKMKEYVDFDALEKAIYNGDIQNDVLLEMDKAKTTKEVVKLLVTKVKVQRGQE